jgi:hypothetical protein
LFAQNSKNGFQASKGSVIIVETMGQPSTTLFRLICAGPKFFDISLADAGDSFTTVDERWEILYLDQDLLVCESSCSNTVGELDFALIIWTREEAP